MGDADEPVGRVVAGRYRLRGPLGAGGMGEVWEAYDERLGGRRVVIKMMLDERPSQLWPRAETLEVRRKRFLREVRTTAAIEHLGIPAVYDAGVDRPEGRLFVAMQFLHGRELQTLIDETDHEAAPLPVARAAAIGAQIASVLDEVHRHDVVHRDVKPSNLMLTPGGIVKVLDFGVASLLGSGDNPRLTQVGTTVGTPPYMSPEQALGNTIGPTSDVYALACVLYEVLTGRPPFAESASRSHQWHHVHSAPPRVRDARPDVPEEIESLLRGMLAKEPDARPDAAEVYERLLPFASRPVGPGMPADIADLDPCLPFVRPLGSRVRRPRAATPAPPSAPAPAQDLSERAIDEIGERAEALLHRNLFVEAFDVLEEARERVAEPALRNELSFKLATAKFVAGQHTEAAALFGEVSAHLVEQYGPDDPDVHLAHYYLAQCRDKSGDVSGAVEAFRDVAAATFDPSDEQAVERHLDALAALMRLHAAGRRRDLVMDAAAGMREAIRRYRPDDAETMLAELDAYLARLVRLLGDPAS
ncbi:serine/threonine protein kinase [Actinomadura spongiicola]|uniref:non-specific serine/threonine protein kinase n=1 Tax=Actinomadura spongiicola TaxID=2303421 RepID=A0A372GHI0_9ACTN|nr:serine/threonine-protein kinase [Actinomadura spongiicola]RFS84830.1 serine/threonine protein kinase [Actinomadura spongiicola]